MDMNKNRSENGTFLSSFPNLGNGGKPERMYVPAGYKKPIKALLKELNSIDPDISDPEEILWEIIEIIEEKSKNII